MKKKVDSTNSKKLSKHDWLVIRLNGNKTCNITRGKHLFLIFTECTLGSTHYRDANMNNHAQNNVRMFLSFNIAFSPEVRRILITIIRYWILPHELRKSFCELLNTSHDVLKDYWLPISEH